MDYRPGPDTLQSKNDSTQQPPIAIVSMGVRVPGALSSRALWNLIHEKTVTASAPPPRRWPTIRTHLRHAAGGHDKAYHDVGCFLSPLESDPPGLPFDADVLDSLDPLHRVVLHAGFDAWHSAKVADLTPERCGVILANIALPTEATSELTQRTLAPLLVKRALNHLPAAWKNRFLETTTNQALQYDYINQYIMAMPAALLSRALGISGGSHTLDAACASSLYAISLAMHKLRTYALDAVVTGGASMAQTLFTQIGFTQLQALSRSSVCRPFDPRADGLLVGEGAVLFVLKRLPDALKARDEILGVIRGIGLSNDLAGSLLSPASEGQLRAMHQAYQQAGWDPRSVQLIECHGTGTPRGDGVELESLRKLWNSSSASASTHAQAVIGSIKANIGHLLTGAGAAGLARLVLALRNRTLPPQANADSTHRHPLLEGSPFRLLEAPEPWEPLMPGQPRRAALSAFGFGGINAHLLLEEWLPTPESAKTIHALPSQASPTRTRYAIVGMGARFGRLKTVSELTEAFFASATGLGQRPASRWEGLTSAELDSQSQRHPTLGAWVDVLSIPPGRFKIPPGELGAILPQHLLMLDAATAAVQDMGARDPVLPERRGVVVGLGLDLETTHHAFRWVLPSWLVALAQAQGHPLSEPDALALSERLAGMLAPPLDTSRTLGSLGGMIASRIAREVRAGGPSFGVSNEDGSSFRALEVAMQMLESQQVDWVVAGAVDLTGHLSNILATAQLRPWSSHAAIPFDAAAAEPIPGEGAGAVVLKRLEDAERAGDRIYAIIDGFGQAGEGPESTGKGHFTQHTTPLDRALQSALSGETLASRLPGLVVGYGLGTSREVQQELERLDALFGPSDVPTTALGSAAHVVGAAGAASGMASLLCGALSLYHRTLPPLTGYETPIHAELRTHSPLHVPIQAQHWLRNRSDGPRRALITGSSCDQNTFVVCLSEPEDPQDVSQGIPGPRLQSSLQPRRQALETSPRTLPLLKSAPGLFLLRGEGREGLREQVAQLQKRVSDHCLSPHVQQSPLEQVQLLAHQWATHDASGTSSAHGWCRAVVCRDPGGLLDQLERLEKDLRTPTQQGIDPRRLEGELALVFPGSGNHFPGMGLEIGAAFPQILESQDLENRSLLNQLMPWRLFPWRNTWQQGWEQDASALLAQDPLAQIFGQVSYGVLMSDLLRQFGLLPDAMIGYSLGESAALFASRTWTSRDEMLQRCTASPLFQKALSGEYAVARQAWDHAGQAGSPEDGWCAAVINRDEAKVRPLLTPQTWLLIVNAPNECVIGGRRSQVTALAQRLGCQLVQLEGVPSVHCPLVTPVADPYRALHLLPAHTPLPAQSGNIRVYSCAFARAYAPTSDAAADSILANALHGFDFRDVIEQAWKDGVRIFVEPGPQASCTRMIRRILGDRPYRAIGVCSRGHSGLNTLIHGLAKLAEAGVPVTTAPLYAERQPGGASLQTPTSAALTNPPQHLWPGFRVHLTDDLTPALPEAPEELERPEAHPASLTAASPAQPEPLVQTPAPSLERRPHTHQSIYAMEAQLAMLLELHRQTQTLLQQMHQNAELAGSLHSQFLEQTLLLTQQQQQLIERQQQLWRALTHSPQPADIGLAERQSVLHQSVIHQPVIHQPVSQLATSQEPISPPTALDRSQCLTFAIGALSNVFGADWSDVDTHPTRVRLPDEPLMLVDRILRVEGSFGKPGAGRVVTEHDVLPSAWYLDGGRAPVCISVEAGQADLFLSGWLGIDRLTLGQRVYRLLDAKVTFHRDLPRPGETIQYDIHIDRFICQADTWMFFFWFDGTINGQKVITMRDGCAGFFSPTQLEQGRGITGIPDPKQVPRRTTLDGQPSAHFRPLIGLEHAAGALDDAALDALRSGHLERAFGPDFAGITLAPSLRLPGGRMKLVDRILHLDPAGGRYGQGLIVGEADITPDAWFLTCHFKDDPVMPGTLMYECCLHTLRVLLLRLGWVLAGEDTHGTPIPEVAGKLKCRGQVLPATSKVQYRIELHELGYAPQPYAIADALMYADGHPIVWMEDMSFELTGITGHALEAFWIQRADAARHASPPLSALAGVDAARVYPYERILAFATGKPSDAFGAPYQIFDHERRIARLPGPPYCFISRIVDCGPRAWVLERGAFAVAEYDVPPDAWYFQANRTEQMPFAVLLEIALQPCGWLAAWLGSALRSPLDLHFRNLEGEATLLAPVGRALGTLRIEVQLTEFSEAGGMILQRYELSVDSSTGPVYRGWTRFGFFPTQALLQQVGVRGADARRWVPPHEGECFELPDLPPYTPDDADQNGAQQNGAQQTVPKALEGLPGRAFRMIDRIVSWHPAGGPQGLGHIIGEKPVRPDEWFFSAHFYQDPVIPGSLGLEAFIQLLKVIVLKRWGAEAFEGWMLEPIALGQQHRWWYRGQIIPSHSRVKVEASVTHVVDSPMERMLQADGFVSVDGRIIYELREFALRLTRRVE